MTDIPTTTAAGVNTVVQAVMAKTAIDALRGAVKRRKRRKQAVKEAYA